MGLRQRTDAPFHRRNVIVDGIPLGQTDDGLNHRQRVFGPMIHFPRQQHLPGLRFLAEGNIGCDAAEPRQRAVGIQGPRRRDLTPSDFTGRLDDTHFHIECLLPGFNWPMTDRRRSTSSGWMACMTFSAVGEKLS